MILLFAFVFFYFQLSMIFAFGSFAHYATFMAARAYLSAGPDPQDQYNRAKDVIARTLKRSEANTGTDRFPSIARGEGQGDVRGAEIGPGSNYQDGVRALSWMQGVRYSFRSRLFLMPLSGKIAPGVPQSVKFTSESWLGKEPSAADCSGTIKGIYDNGC